MLEYSVINLVESLVDFSIVGYCETSISGLSTDG